MRPRPSTAMRGPSSKSTAASRSTVLVATREPPATAPAGLASRSTAESAVRSAAVVPGRNRTCAPGRSTDAATVDCATSSSCRLTRPSCARRPGRPSRSRGPDQAPRVPPRSSAGRCRRPEKPSPPQHSGPRQPPPPEKRRNTCAQRAAPPLRPADTALPSHFEGPTAAWSAPVGAEPTDAEGESWHRPESNEDPRGCLGSGRDHGGRARRPGLVGYQYNFGFPDGISEQSAITLHFWNGTWIAAFGWES